MAVADTDHIPVVFIEDEPDIGIYKANGLDFSGGGGIVPTIVGDHNDRVTDHTILLVLDDQGGGVMSIHNERTGSLRASTRHHEPIVLIPAEVDDEEDIHRSEVLQVDETG